MSERDSPDISEAAVAAESRAMRLRCTPNYHADLLDALRAALTTAKQERAATPRLRHDQGLAIAQALRGEISHGKLAEILGIDDVHAFKLAAGSFEEQPARQRIVMTAGGGL